MVPTSSLITFAAAQNTNILSALGIDWRLFVLQVIAFLVLMWALGKWVYPIFIEAIDKRREEIAQGAKAVEEAKKTAEESQKKFEEALVAARKEAEEIIAASHKEASVIVSEAEEKARHRAKNIIAEAKTQIDGQIQDARRALKKETLQLVAQATEQVVDEKIDLNKDAHLVEQAIKSVEGKA